jgi:type I restriction enzyme S subunit
MSEWRTVRLGDVCDILDSKRVPITASDRKKGIYPYYGANGVQDYVDDYIFDDELVLLAEDGGNFGSKERPIAYRVSGKCWVNNHAHVLKPKNMLNVDYLCYSIMFYDVTSLINGATRSKLNQSAMCKMEIPLPPLETQQKIADILDRASGLIELRRAQIEKLDLLVKSRFVEMFGEPKSLKWELKRLDTIATTRLGKMLDAKQQTGTCTYPYLANFNVQWFSFNLERLNEMDFDEADRKEFSLEEGDLLICEGGEVGRTAIWHGERKNCYFQKALHRVRCNPEMCVPEYIAWVMYFKAHSGQFDGVASSATIAHLPGVKLKALMFPLPPLELQNRFADFVSQADKSKFEMQLGLKKLELQYNALMQQYFG